MRWQPWGEGVAGESKTESRRRVAGKQSKARRDPVEEKTRQRRTQSSPLSKTVGALFRSAREAQHLSQEQVASLAGDGPGELSRTTISSIERGVNLPGLEVLLSLSRVLNIEPTEVLERVNLHMTQPVNLTGVTRDELFCRAEEFFWAGDYRKALATYDAMVEQLILDPPASSEERARLYARIEVNRAAALRRCCALSAARAAAERAVSLSDGMPALQAEAYVVLATLLVQTGRLHFAQDAAEHAVRLSEESASHGLAWIVKGEALFASERFKEARDAFLEARKLVRKARDHKHMINVEGNLGASLIGLGQGKQARARFAKAVELARKYSVPAAEAFWLVELGRCALEESELEKADSYAIAALRIAKPADQVLTIFRAEWLRHLIVRRRNPKAPDRNRLFFLRKLYGRVKEHRGLAVIKEYEEAIIAPATNPDGRRS